MCRRKRLLQELPNWRIRKINRTAERAIFKEALTKSVLPFVCTRLAIV